MTEVLWFENERTKKRYKVLDLDMDGEHPIVRLQGPNSVFTESYSKKRFQEMGYKLVRVEEPDDE